VGRLEKVGLQLHSLRHAFSRTRSPVVASVAWMRGLELTSALRQAVDKRESSPSGRFSPELCTFAPRYGFAVLDGIAVSMTLISTNFEAHSLGGFSYQLF
jgi:hypothetical protein